jgi:hypothetical protein
MSDIEKIAMLAMLLVVLFAFGGCFRRRRNGKEEGS